MSPPRSTAPRGRTGRPRRPAWGSWWPRRSGRRSRARPPGCPRRPSAAGWIRRSAGGSASGSARHRSRLIDPGLGEGAMDTADLEAIRAAVAEAEQKTSGEIVPYLVEESDGYPSALWKGTALGAFAGALVAEAIFFLVDLWNLTPLWIAAPTAVGGALG